MYHYTLKELKALKTTAQTQTDDLKIDTGNMRVWLARTGIADGEPYNNKVTVELYYPNAGKWGRWETIAEYPAE